MTRPHDETSARAWRASRREALLATGAGLGSVALSWLLAEEARAEGLLAARPAHFTPRAKSCIFLLMEGGPSQIDTFDPKPKLDELDGKILRRESKLSSNQTRGERPYLRSPFSFERHGRCGMEVSELFRETAAHVDDIAFVRSVHCDSDNHPAALFHLTTGMVTQGSPSMGAWAVHGLGTLNQDLPAFVVLRDGRPYGGTAAWSNGYLPTSCQGTQLRSGERPVLDLSPPEGVTRQDQRRALDLLSTLNRAHARRLPDHPDLEARLDAYELAFRMQAELPEAVDVSRESAAARASYGLDDGATRAFGTRCLLARRLVERGVRFVQVWAGGWDSHDHVEAGHRNAARQVDRPIAALLADLKERGLLDETLVVWGGEFGRTPDSRKRETAGRDHNPGAMTMWFSGGGAQGGRVVGATDEIGNESIESPYHLRDVHATFLHLLGLDQHRLSVYHGGRRKQLTDTGGRVIEEIL